MVVLPSSNPSPFLEDQCFKQSDALPLTSVSDSPSPAVSPPQVDSDTQNSSANSSWILVALVLGVLGVMGGIAWRNKQ